MNMVKYKFCRRIRGKYKKIRSCPYCKSKNTSWIQNVKRTILDSKNKEYINILKSKSNKNSRKNVCWISYFRGKHTQYPSESLYECNSCGKIFVIVIED